MSIITTAIPRSISASGEKSADAQKYKVRKRFRLKHFVSDSVRPKYPALPSGWVEITHASGLPAYYHCQTKTYTFSRPFNEDVYPDLGNTVPLIALPGAYSSLQQYIQELSGDVDPATQETQELSDGNRQVGQQLHVDIAKATENAGPVNNSVVQYCGSVQNTSASGYWAPWRASEKRPPQLQQYPETEKSITHFSTKTIVQDFSERKLHNGKSAKSATAATGTLTLSDVLNGGHSVAELKQLPLDRVILTFDEVRRWYEAHGLLFEEVTVVRKRDRHFSMSRQLPLSEMDGPKKWIRPSKPKPIL